MRLTDDELDWLAARVPDAPVSPKGGRPAMDKRQALRGIFWVLDNGAKWKDLPREFGSKSSVHKYFMLWTRAGVFEAIMRDAGRFIEERNGFRLYECFIDATFSKARGGGDGIGATKAGKGVKIMVLVDARGLPVAVSTASASPHESTLVQGLFEFMLTVESPARIIGDKAYDSDALDEELAGEGIELIAPHRRALGLEAESRGPTATPTVALAPPAATLSDSLALWLTGGLSLTGGLLSGALNELRRGIATPSNRVVARCRYTHGLRHAA